MSAPQPESPVSTMPARSGATDPGFFSAQSMPRIAPFAAYMLFIVLADVLHRLGLNESDLLWLYPVKIGVVTLLLLACRRQYGELLEGLPRIGHLLAATAVGVIVFVLWIALNAPWMQIGTAAGYDPSTTDGSVDWLLVTMRITGAALVVPVMEELFWRSFLQRWLSQADFLACAPARVGLKSFLATAVLFGFEHNLWLAGIVAGLAYGFLYVRTANLWSPILAHAVTNGLLGAWVLATGNWAYW